jgi:hypothetical protein
MPAKMAGRRILRVTCQIDDASGKLNDYQVVPLKPHPDVARAAWRFRKRGMASGQELAIYDVKLDCWGLSCDCRGFERHGYCKHADAIRALLGNILPPTPTTPRIHDHHKQETAQDALPPDRPPARLQETRPLDG